MKKELSLSLADIRYVSISCKGCTTRILLDLAGPKDSLKLFTDEMQPAACPGCRMEYDAAIRVGILNLKAAYSSLLPIAKWIEVRGESQSILLS